MGFDLGRKKTNCCYECPDRTPECHGSCERYKAYRAEIDAKNAECMRKYELNYNLSAQRFDNWKKATNRRLYRSKYRKG